MDNLELLESKLDPRLTAITLVLSEMRKHLGLKPEDFRVAYNRVTEGSDGTDYQDEYVMMLKLLIGFEL